MELECGDRNRSSGKWIEDQSSNTRPPLVDHLIITVTLDRHWPHFLSRPLKLATKAPSIWVRHCWSTEWAFPLSLHLRFSFSRHSRQTLTTLKLTSANIQDEGTRYLSDALRIGQVRENLLLSRIELLCSFHVDTDQIGPELEQNRQCRCSASRRRLDDQSSASMSFSWSDRSLASELFPDTRLTLSWIQPYWR